MKLKKITELVKKINHINAEINTQSPNNSNPSFFHLSEDTKQNYKSFFSLILESSKVLMAALLVVFVPQKCPENADQLCTFSDNFTDLTGFNAFVLAFNFLTLAFFIYQYKIEYNREKWCIKYLDIDENKPNTYLKEELKRYESIEDEMKELNTKYLKYTLITIFLYFINFLLSAILIYAFYYLDYRSITVLLTNIVLVVDKLYNAYSISLQSVEQELACSAYMKTAVVFNRVDEDYRLLTNEELQVVEREIQTNNSEIENEGNITITIEK
jgi:hypothetical protein